MLVLSRKIGEEVVIGSTIRVVVLKVAGGRVKLGIRAPEDVRICRQELSRREPRRASTSPEGTSPLDAERNGQTCMINDIPDG